MAIRLEGSIRRWVGLSTDPKPYVGLQIDGSTITTAHDIPSGSSFLESDTGRIWRWSGTEWTLPQAAADEHLLVLQGILVEIRELRQVVEIAITAPA